MKRVRKLNRRSFLASVVGGAAAGSLLVVSDDARALQSDCSDSDPISNGGDPGGRGRNCQSRPRTGCSDRDPSDPGGRGRNCTAAAHRLQRQRSLRSERPGRRCGEATQQNGAYATGRRERRYQVCWVDHPSRSNDECNMQTYSEWAITYSDGRVEYDTGESQRRQAEMTSGAIRRAITR